MDPGRNTAWKEPRKMRSDVPSLPPYWADEPAMFTDEDGFKRRRLWRRHPLPNGRPARIALAAYQPYPGQPYPGQPYPGQPYPGRPGEERLARPDLQGKWLLGIYIITPADDIAARAAVMVWRRPDECFYVGGDAFADFGAAAEAALERAAEAPVS
jgi:hypothetical protein